MRIILDENVPRQLIRELPGHQCSTVTREGWSGIDNGSLLNLVEGRFDVFVTADRNIYAQQNSCRANRS